MKEKEESASYAAQAVWGREQMVYLLLTLQGRRTLENSPEAITF